jgi:cytochrome P450
VVLTDHACGYTFHEKMLRHCWKGAIMDAKAAPPNVFNAGLPVLSYELAESPGQVYPRILKAQQEAPIAIGPLGPEVLSYELCRAILRDGRFGIPPGINLMAQGVTSGPLFNKVAASILCLEGVAHDRLRRLVSTAFTPRATARLEDTIESVVHELVDRVADARRCDIVDDIARPYPIPIICDLIGAPREDWEQFSTWTSSVFKAFSFDGNIAQDEPEVMRAWGELDDYVDTMVADRRRRLTDDLLSELIRAEDDGDRLSADELRMMVSSLLMAGTDTTRNQLAASVFVLCDHLDQWALLGERPELAMSAVEESMRHSPAVCSAVRIAFEDAEFGGYLFPAGTFVVVSTFAANRDPAIYDDPERFDITRDAAPAILTFGGGAHYCLGANLARRELAEALRILANRMPNPRLVAPVPWKPLLGMSGPTRMLLEFDTASAVASDA